MEKKEPIRIDSLIEKIIKNAKSKKREFSKKKDLLRFLELRFTPGISKHIQLGTLRKRKMVIKVDSAIWMQEMNFRSRELVSLINEFFGENKVERITLRRQ